MGHYWSEMRSGPTPHEKFAEALESCLRDMGYREVRIEFTTLYSCNHCGCLVTWLAQHIQYCSPQQAAEVNQQIRRAIELVTSLVSPIEQLQLVTLAEQHKINIYSLNCALSLLKNEKRISVKHSFTGPGHEYRDAVISQVPKEEPECPPES